jgi:ribosomal protein S14
VSEEIEQRFAALEERIVHLEGRSASTTNKCSECGNPDALYRPDPSYDARTGRMAWLCRKCDNDISQAN